MEPQPQDVIRSGNTSIQSAMRHEYAEAENDATNTAESVEPAYKISDVLFKCTSLGLGTLLGLLSRTGIIIVANELGTDLSGIVWSNFLACFSLGLFQKAFSVLELPKSHNARLGLTTGFCGTFSSFSSAALELFNVAAGRTPRSDDFSNGIQNDAVIITKNLSNFVGITFVHIGVSVIGQHIGDTTAKLILHRKGPAIMQWARDNSSNLAISSISSSILIVFASCIEIYFSSSFNFFLYVILSLIFALPGASLRYSLSKLNFDRNEHKRSFPLGTFIANVLGSSVLAVTTLLTLGIKPAHKTDRLINDGTYCCILSAVGLGFCGALTTMSTFIAELTSMTNQEHVYLYAVPSVAATVGSFVVIWGTYSWGVGYASKAACL